MREDQHPATITYPYLIDFNYIWIQCLILKFQVMSHEKAKEQTKIKKQPAKSLKEKRAAKKAKKAEKSK
jgi:hypothetical protein